MSIKPKIVILILAISALSCQEWMELIPPQGLIREEFWKTKEDVEATMMGAYDSFSTMDRLLFLYGELRGDMIIGDYWMGGNERRMSESTIYPDNYLCNWAPFYRVINVCNEVIKNAPDVKKLDDTFTNYQLQSFLAEAYFLRSLNYFYLVRLFKDVPYITIPTENDDTFFYVTQTPGDEILDSLILDLETYRPFATTDGYQTDEELKGRATKAAFDALLADICLWRFDYTAVLEHVARLEADEDMVLMPPGNFFDLFYPGNALESIFEIQYDAENNHSSSLYGLTRHDNHNVDPSETAIELFSKATAKELVRGEDASIRKEGEGNYIIWKYIGREPDGETTRSGNEQGSANWIIYRYSDVLLMKAEALSQLERYQEALAVINMVREDHAGVNPLIDVGETPSAYEDAILNERALELAFEGKRWFDLLRMGRRNDFARKGKFIEIIVKNIPSTQKRIQATKLTNPQGWYLPVYEYELERNKNLVQNPYYDN